MARSMKVPTASSATARSSSSIRQRLLDRRLLPRPADAHGANILNGSSWTKSGPVFTKQPGAYGPGHNCVVQDATGQWWNLYHANNPYRPGLRRLSPTPRPAHFFGARAMCPTSVRRAIGSLVTERKRIFWRVNFPLTETSGTSAASSGCGHAAHWLGTPRLVENPALKLKRNDRLRGLRAGSASGTCNVSKHRPHSGRVDSRRTLSVIGPVSSPKGTNNSP